MAENFMEKSEGTRRFMSTFHRFEDRCRCAARNGRLDEAGPVANTLIDLLIAIGEDFNQDEVIFLADEHGWWQVSSGTGLLEILLEWLSSQYANQPEDYAQATTEVIFGLAPVSGAREYSSLALRAASPSQAAALRSRLGETL